MFNSDKTLFNICADMIYDYISFIHVYIKAKKASNELVARADEEYDMYEILFFEGLNKALKCDGGNTIYDKETIRDVANGIKQILKSQKTYTPCLVHRQECMHICVKVFQQFVTNTKEMYSRKDVNEDE